MEEQKGKVEESYSIMLGNGEVNRWREKGREVVKRGRGLVVRADRGRWRRLEGLKKSNEIDFRELGENRERNMITATRRE